MGKEELSEDVAGKQGGLAVLISPYSSSTSRRCEMAPGADGSHITDELSLY